MTQGKINQGDHIHTAKPLLKEYVRQVKAETDRYAPRTIRVLLRRGVAGNELAIETYQNTLKQFVKAQNLEQSGIDKKVRWRKTEWTEKWYKVQVLKEFKGLNDDDLKAFVIWPKRRNRRQGQQQG